MDDNIAGYLAGCHALSEQDPIAAGRNLELLYTTLAVYDLEPTDPRLVASKTILEKVAMESALMFARIFYERQQPDIAAELLEMTQEHAITLGEDIGCRIESIVKLTGN